MQLKWTQNTIFQKFPICTEMKEVEKHFHYWLILAGSPLEKVTRYKCEFRKNNISNKNRDTGCARPCTYTEYVKTQVCILSINYHLTEPPSLFHVHQDSVFFASPENISGLSFGFSSNSKTVSEEVFIYPPTSFLAEAGGALGLFLGFNFVMVWDFIEMIIIMMRKKYLNLLNKKNGK